MWNLDFILAREGETEPIAESSYSFFYTRSVNVELNLEAGNYVVLVSSLLFLREGRERFWLTVGLCIG